MVCRAQVSYRAGNVLIYLTASLKVRVVPSE